jgi:hypothetical protein
MSYIRYTQPRCTHVPKHGMPRHAMFGREEVYGVSAPPIVVQMAVRLGLTIASPPRIATHVTAAIRPYSREVTPFSSGVAPVKPDTSLTSLLFF